MFSPLVEQAMRVAARQHRDHHRKSSDLPYITHPASVAMILLRAGFDDDEILAAALLHDAIEDTDYTIDKLQDEFPANVVEYVTASTERKRDDSGQQRSWRERKQEHIQQVASASLNARAVVLADKLHNLGTMLFDVDAGEELWSRFGAPAEQVLWYHQTMLEAAAGNDEELSELATQCRQLLARLASTTEVA